LIFAPETRLVSVAKLVDFGKDGSGMPMKSAYL
jgi:hypothetical protein